MIEFFAVYLSYFSYFGIVISLAFSGYIVPLPEEIVLLLVGYLAGFGFFDIYWALAMSVLGVFLGDAIVFWLGLKGGGLMGRIKSRMRPDKIARYEEFMRRHAGRSIFLLRFVVGLRFLSPLFAVSLGIKFSKFQFYDFLAIMIYVPIVVFLGYAFHQNISLLIGKAQAVRHVVFTVLEVGVGVIIGFAAHNLFFKIKE